MLNINLNYMYAPWASLEMDMLRFKNIVFITIIMRIHFEPQTQNDYMYHLIDLHCKI